MNEDRLRTASDLFDPTRLRIARQAAMLHKKELAERLGISGAAVSQYENGSTSPSPKIVAALALALGMPVDFFGGDRPFGEAPATSAHFRSLRSTSKQERERAFAYALLTWEFTRVVERYIRLPSYNLPADLSLSTEERPAEAEVAARRARSALELGTGPVPNAVRLLEARGVVCTRLPANTRRVFAFSCDFPSRPVVVLSTERTHLAAGRFDAAHELGHLLLHRDEEPGTHAVERQANVFASEFLAPASEIADVLPSKVDWKRLIDLKVTWGISMQALLFRARALRVMPEHTYRRAVTELNSRGWRTKEPGDDGRTEEPVVLGRAIEMLNDQGKSLEELSDESRIPTGLIEMIAPTDERLTLNLGAD